MPPDEGLPQLAACGFDGVELWPDPLHEWGATHWAAALQRHHLSCLQLCPYFNFMGGQESLQRSRTILQEFLSAAHLLDCHKLRVFTGPPWGDWVVGAHDATPRQWTDAIAGLQEFCDQAAPQGVELCLECHGGSLMEDGPSALRLIDGVDRPNLTVNLQLPLYEESWQDSLRALDAYTTHIHIHNWTGPIGEGHLTFLEDGTFDWGPVVRHLVRLGRPLCLAVEHPDHNGRDDAWETARRDGAYLNRLRAALSA